VGGAEVEGGVSWVMDGGGSGGEGVVAVAAVA